MRPDTKWRHNTAGKLGAFAAVEAVAFGAAAAAGSAVGPIDVGSDSSAPLRLAQRRTGDPRLMHSFTGRPTLDNIPPGGILKA